MSEPRDLRDLVGDDVPEQELDELGSAHDALLASDAAPEIPASLTAAVLAIPASRRGAIDRRRVLAGLAIAAAIGGAAFGIGFWAGDNGDGGFPVQEVIALNPTPAGPDEARMEIDVLPADLAGNWRMLADVSGLPPLPEGGYYEVWLTKDDDAAEPCGRFVVDENGEAHRVWLNAPYKLEGYDRWVVNAHVPGREDSVWLLDGPVATPA